MQGYNRVFWRLFRRSLTANIVKNDILLLHGQKDPVVPLERMKQAEQKLKNLSSSIETKIYEQLEHSINEEGLVLGCDFIKKRL